MQKIVDFFSRHPYKLFLTDGIGALLTVFMLVLMLLFFKELIGIDREMLVTLISIATVYAIFSLSCYLIRPANPTLFLKVIAIANICYSCCMMFFVILGHETLTLLGVTYFLIESMIIFYLAMLEFKVINIIQNSGLS